MTVIVLGGVSATVPVAGTMTQVAHVVIWHTCVVLRTQSSRDAAFGEILGGGSNAVAAVGADPAVAYEEGERVDPT